MTAAIDFPKEEVSKEHILKVAADYKHRSEKRKPETEDARKQYFIQRYSDEDILAEAVIIDGKPYFVVSDKGDISSHDPGNTDRIGKTHLRVVSRIELTNVVFNPPGVDGYVNRPYVFTWKELDSLADEVGRTQTHDSLYADLKELWKKYNDASDFHISLCAADTLFSYFQDKIRLCHYVWFVGGNGSGKSNGLTTFNVLGYRNLMSTDLTAANIYQYLGSIQEGQGTLCVDELDDIDRQHGLARIFKNGYTAGFPVLRTDTSNGRKQERYYTYCVKMAAAEKLPDPVKAKGLLERIIPLQCFYGDPKYDISEVLSSTGDIVEETLLGELLDMRKKLLLYKLLHWHDSIPKVHVNLKGREYQLFAGLLRLFQGTQTMNELLPMIGSYISERRRARIDSLHAYLYRTIRAMMKAQNKTEFDSALIWSMIKEGLEGGEDLAHRQTFWSVEFGKLSQKRTVQTLCDIFGARPGRSNKARSLLFDEKKLDRLGRLYDIEVQVQVQEVTDKTHVTLPSPPDAEPKSGGDSDHSTIDNEICKTSNILDRLFPANPSPNMLESIVNVAHASNASQIQCPYCPKQFGSAEDVVTHSIGVHPGRPITADMAEKGFI